MNKMAARVLTYKLVSSSYGDSKLKEWKNFTKKIVQQSLSPVYGRQVFSDAVKVGTISAATNGE